MRLFLMILLSAVFLASCKQTAKNYEVRKYVNRYLKHDQNLSYEDSMFHSQQPKHLGDVNGDGEPDSVFVLSPLDSSEHYFSYYFLDTTIPRLNTISYCADNNYIFPVEDIDEDGKQEIGLLQFSCNGRTQQLEVYSLKDDKWEQVGQCTYDMNFEDMLPMQQRIVKTGKGKFKILHVNYDAVNESLVKEWRTFSF